MLSRSRYVRCCAVTAIALLSTTRAVAAEQGSIADGSSGSIAISASVGSRTQISAHDDMVLVGGNAAQQVCARGNTHTRLYSLRLSEPAGDGGVRRSPLRVALNGNGATALMDQTAAVFGGDCAGPILSVADAPTSTRTSDGVLTLLVVPD